MASGVQPEFSPHLYDHLRGHLLDKDQERAIELIYQLLSSGCPLAEVIAQVTRSSPALVDGQSDVARPPLVTLHASLAPASSGSEEADRQQTVSSTLLIDRAGRVTADGLARDSGGLAKDVGDDQCQLDRHAVCDADTFPRDAPITVVPPFLDDARSPGVRHEPRRSSLQRAALVGGCCLLGVLAVGSAGAFRANLIGVTETTPNIPVKAPTDAVAKAGTTGVAAAAIVVDDVPVTAIKSTSGGVTPQPGNTSSPPSVASPNLEAPVVKEPPPDSTGEGTLTAMIAPAQTPTPQARLFSDTEIAELISRGDSFFMSRDVTSARLFYRYGADAGNGAAALRLGETFDPSFLKRANLRRVTGDLGQALAWYRRARDLGNADAEILLKSLKPTGD